MHVIVNGRQTEIAATNLDRLLDELDYDDTYVAVAVNAEVVPRARWADTRLEQRRPDRDHHAAAGRLSWLRSTPRNSRRAF